MQAKPVISCRFHPSPYLGDVKGAFPQQARCGHNQPPLKRSKEGPEKSCALTPATVVGTVLYHPSFLAARYHHAVNRERRCFRGIRRKKIAGRYVGQRVRAGFQTP